MAASGGGYQLVWVAGSGVSPGSSSGGGGSSGPVTLSQIAQSGATTGQLIVWNGTTWTAAALSAAGLPMYTSSATANTLAQRDGAGAIQFTGVQLPLGQGGFTLGDPSTGINSNTTGIIGIYNSGGLSAYWSSSGALVQNGAAGFGGLATFYAGLYSTLGQFNSGIGLNPVSSAPTVNNGFAKLYVDSNTGRINYFNPTTGTTTLLDGVTSVALTLPSSIFSVSGSPITGSGTINAALANQPVNAIWGGPASGSPGLPSFRSLVVADIPNLPAANITGLAPSATTDTTNAANISSGVLNSARLSGVYTGITGVGTLTAGSVPVSLVTGLAPSATTDATNATNITSGTLASARLSGAYSGITAVGNLTAGSVPVSLVTGLAPSATTDTTNAANISSGTLPAGRISGSYPNLTGIGTLASGAVPASLVTGLAASATTDTTNAANITSGVLAGARLSGAYTGITQVGTLTAGAIPTSLLTGYIASGQLAAATPVTGQALVYTGSGNGLGWMTLAAGPGTGSGNVVYATPADGSSGAPSLRALVPADVPTLPASKISGLATSATTDTTNATNITSGTLANARLSYPLLSSTLGSSSAPSFAFSGKSGTGFWTDSSGNFNVSVSQNFLFQLSTAGATFIGIPLNYQPINTPQMQSSVGQSYVKNDGQLYYLPQNSTTEVMLSTGATVKSVALALPNIFTVTGSPVTSTGTLTATLAQQNGNQVLIAPNGATGTPTFRTLGTADIPNLPSTQITGLAASATTDTTNAGNITAGTLPPARLNGSYTSITGVGTLTAGSIPSSLITGLAASATTDTTNATNITTGTLASGRISGQYLGITGIGTLTAGSVPASLITGLAASATTDTTNASNITSGLLAYGRLSSATPTSGQALYYNGTSAAWLSLAASATTDTTNAANITSGTLPIARISTTTPTSNQYLFYNGSALSFSTLANSAFVDTTNASNISIGTLAQGRLSGQYIGITGVGNLTAGSVPASLVTGLATSATTDTTNAANISSGVLPYQRLSSTTPSANYVLTWNGTVATWTSAAAASAPAGTANQVYATPDGASGNATLRSLVANDVPTIPSTKVSGLAASATTDTTNAANSIRRVAGGTTSYTATAADNNGVILSTANSGSTFVLTLPAATTITGSTPLYIQCVNTQGTYQVSIPSGYSLQAAGQTAVAGATTYTSSTIYSCVSLLLYTDGTNKFVRVLDQTGAWSNP